MLKDTDPGLTAHLDRIKKLSDELLRAQDACEAAQAIAARIQLELVAARAALKIPEPLVCKF